MVDVGNLNVVLSAENSLDTGLASALSSLTSFASPTTLAIAGIGTAIAATAGTAIKGVSDFIDFESAMTAVRKTTGLSAEATAELGNAFREMSLGPLPQSAEELAKIGEVAGQLGISGTDDIKTFTETVAKMALVSEMTEEQAALALGKISLAFGLPVSEAEKLGSVINELSNATAASSAEIAEALQTIAPAAKSLGLTTDEAAALSTTLVAAGFDASRAGTEISSALVHVVQNIDEASAFMGSDFKQALEQDAGGAMIALIQKLSEVESGVDKTQIATDIFGQVGAKAMKSLSENTAELSKELEITASEFENASSLEKEFNIFTESTAVQLANLKNQFQEIFLQIGQAVLPILKQLMPVFSSIATSLNGSVGPAFADLLGGIIDVATEIYDFLSPTLTQVKDIFLTQVWPAAKKMFDIFEQNMPLLESVVQIFLDTLPAVAAAAGGILSFANTVLTVLQPVFDLLGWILDIIEDISSVITGDLIKNFEKVGDFFDDITDFFGGGSSKSSSKKSSTAKSTSNSQQYINVSVGEINSNKELDDFLEDLADMFASSTKR